MSSEESTPPDDWTTIEAVDRGRPIIFRIRTGLEAASHFHERWPNRMAVVWTFPLEGAEGASGLPTGDQQNAMNRFEDAIVAGIETPKVALLTSVATSAGRREWVLYCGPSADFNKAFNAALRGHSRYPLALQVAPDAGWRGYRGLLKAVSL